MKSPMIHVLAALLGLAGMAGACANDVPTLVPVDLAPSTFELSVAGAVLTSVSGSAHFGTITSALPAQFALNMASLDQQYFAALARKGSRPGVGRVPLGRGVLDALGLFITSPSLPSRSFFATRGYLEVVSSSDGEMTGTINFTAMELSGNAVVVVTGRFRASCSPIPGLSCS